MNSQQRRQRKRLEARLKEQISVNATLKPPSRSQTAPKQSLSRIKQGLQAFRKTFSKTKVLVTLVLTLAGHYALFRPHVSVEPFLSLNPVDPYTTQFTLKNENRAFEIHNIESVCWPRNMETSHRIRVLSLVPLPNVKRAIPSLEAGFSSTVDCRPMIGGIGTYTGTVNSAELELIVSYKQSWWPFSKTERFAFRAMAGVDKSIHWMHITPSEEKPLLP